MEQKYQDWKNLDPMFFWKYVMPKSQHRIPKVVFLDFDIDNPEIEKICSKYPEVYFIIEEGEYSRKKDFLEIVNYRWRDRMEYWQWLESWKFTDYVIANKDDIELWIQPALCGVKILFDVEDLGDTVTPIDTVGRIENWEWAKTLLTKS